MMVVVKTLAVVMVVATAGCIRPNLATCGDVTCPTDTMCIAALGLCASPGAIAACHNADGTEMPDGSECTAGDVVGTCTMGVCIEEQCNDGVVTGQEDCDGSNLNGHTCADFQLYYGAPTCSPITCRLEVGSCIGSCGDGDTQADQGEECDTAPPQATCVDRGYNYGDLACDRCRESSSETCGDFALRPFLSSPAQTTLVDADAVGAIVAYAISGSGLYVIDEGYESSLSGSFVAVGALPGSGATGSDRVFAAEADALEELDTSDPMAVARGTRWPVGGTVAGLAVDADARQVWVAYTGSDGCHAGVLDASDTWHEQGLVSANPCADRAVTVPGNACSARSAIVLGGATPFVCDDSGSGSNIYYLAGSAWVQVQDLHATALDRGRGSAVVAMTSPGSADDSGLVELTPSATGIAIVDPPGAPAPLLDALGIGDQYAAIGVGWSLVGTDVLGWRIAPGEAPFELAPWQSVSPVWLRRLANGRIAVAGAHELYLVDPMSISDLEPRGVMVSGVRVFGDRAFLGWNAGGNSGASSDGTLFTIDGSGSEESVADAIFDVTMTGDTAYVAEGDIRSATGAVYTWQPPLPGSAAPAPVELTTVGLAGTPIAVSAAPPQAVAAITTDGVTRQLYTIGFGVAFGSGWTEQATASLGVPAAVFAENTTSYYVAFDQLGVDTGGGGSLLYHHTAAGWTQVTDAAGSAVGLGAGSATHLDLLADGQTLVLSGTSDVLLLCGLGSDLSPCPNQIEQPATALTPAFATGATGASGMSPTDVWLTGARGRASDVSGLAHYDGSDTSPVAVPGWTAASGVAVTPDVVLVSGASTYKIARLLDR